MEANHRRKKKGLTTGGVWSKKRLWRLWTTLNPGIRNRNAKGSQQLAARR